MLKQEIRECALSLGFSNFGIARAAFLEADFQVLKQASENGYFADCHYLYRNPEQRCNPELLMANTQSILVFLHPYPVINSPNSHLKMAKFALAEDYHKLIRKKLKQIGKLLPKSAFKICVDTSPILEKVWAMRAGLGWIGKHKILLTENGSYFNIGIILSDLEFEYDSPKENLCGNCCLCVESCPNQALNSGFLDCNRCISYQTIEAKTSNPELRYENYIYGCDICQDICPYNRGILKSCI